MTLDRIQALAFAACLLTALTTSAANASDGQLEINATCALQTGCFSGDSAGYPVTITSPGSYLLTGNLEVLGEDTTAIRILADNVSLDLGGFRVRCRRAVLVIGGGPTPLCSSVDGNGSGIVVDNIDLRHGNEVKNGSVVGTASFGVRLGWNSTVRNMRIDEIGGTAIQTYFGSLVEGNIVSNSDIGINQQFIGGFRGNVLRGNNFNVIGGLNLGANMCENGLCP